jgi:transposase-like protein
MDIHKNARLTPKGRERIVRQVLSGQTPKAAALAVGVCPRTVRKWLARYSVEGLAGLEDRSSRPHRLRQPTPQEVIEIRARCKNSQCDQWQKTGGCRKFGACPPERRTRREARLQQGRIAGSEALNVGATTVDRDVAQLGALERKNAKQSKGSGAAPAPSGAPAPSS